MPMPNRNIEGQYRYAYQGQEKDPETGMEAFQLRLWDSRIGRWLTTDPYGQYHSPYLGMGNDPINGIDPDGGFKTKFGAWLYKTFNGTGGSLFENDYGTWGIDISDGSYESGVNIITGTQWESNNLNKFALGKSSGANFNTSLLFFGLNFSGDISQVQFTKFPSQTSFYANGSIGDAMGTEVDVSVGLDFEGFIGFYDGDAKNISQNSLEGVFYKNSLGAGASIGFELSGSIAYVQTAADIYGGTWTFIAAGVHGSVGPQVALTGGVKIGLTTSVGQSNYLGSIPTPFSILSTIKK